jgi:glycosyltransferase involved in cell wall biosynthesis
VKRLAYVVNKFPVLSETFIANEIRELRRRGLDIQVYSLFQPEESERLPRTEEQIPVYYYLPTLSPFSLIKSHMGFFLRHMGAYVKTLFYVLRNRGKGHSLFKTVFCMIRGEQPPKHDRQDMVLHFILAVPLAKRIVQDDVSLIHAHFMDAAASVVLCLSGLSRIPYSISAHAYDIFTPQENFDQKFESAEFILTCTHYNKHYISETHPHLNADKIKVIYHGINLDRFQPDRTPKAKPPVILSVGRLVPKKGFFSLLHACKALKLKQIPFRCRIIGDGPERPRMEMFVKLNNLVDEVEFTGAVDPADMVAEYRQATLFVLPCVVEENGNRDGIPNVIAEAMAMTLPVVSTTVSGIPELVRHGKTGYLVEPGQVDDLVAYMIELLNSKDRRREMGREGRNMVTEVFDASRLHDDLKAFFQTSLNAHQDQ